MIFCRKSQRELLAILDAEKTAHLIDEQRAADYFRQTVRLNLNIDDLAKRATELQTKLTTIEVACQRAQRAGSKIAVSEIFSILDGE